MTPCRTILRADSSTVERGESANAEGCVYGKRSWDHIFSAVAILVVTCACFLLFRRNSALQFFPAGVLFRVFQYSCSDGIRYTTLHGNGGTAVINSRPAIMGKYVWALVTEVLGRKYAFYSAGWSRTPVDSSGCPPESSESFHEQFSVSPKS